MLNKLIVCPAIYEACVKHYGAEYTERTFVAFSTFKSVPDIKVVNSNKKTFREFIKKGVGKNVKRKRPVR